MEKFFCSIGYSRVSNILRRAVVCNLNIGRNFSCMIFVMSNVFYI